jgi:hypothetical protein
MKTAKEMLDSVAGFALKMEWIIGTSLVIFWFTIAVVGFAFVFEYFHSRSLQRHRAILEDEYERALIYHKAREKEKELEQRQAILEETDREYMDAIRAQEIIEELEKGNIK